MTLKVAFLDVFHGDCAVITFNNKGQNACIVVDGGETANAAKRIAAYLKHENVEIIDLLVATHIDADHINGLIHLLKKNTKKQSDWNKGNKKCIRYYWGPKYDPEWVKPQTVAEIRHKNNNSSRREVMNFVIKSVQQNQDLSKLIRDHIEDDGNIYFPSLRNKPPLDIFDDVKLEILAPDRQIVDSEIKRKALTMTNEPYKSKYLRGDVPSRRGPLTLDDLERIVDINAEEMAKIAKRTANNQSIVFKLTPKANKAKNWKFLFTGDAEHESWDMMLGTKSIKRKLSSKVLKVPHHGSVNGINETAFKKIRPQYSIVSVGQKHGLPDGKTLNLIKSKKNMKLFCTERNNKKKHPGACLLKTNCIRKNKADFRSLSFEIDLATGKETIKSFKYEKGTGWVDVPHDKIWCEENKW